MSKKAKLWLFGGLGVFASLMVATAAVVVIVIFAPSTEAAVSPAAQTNEALLDIRTTGQTIVCGPFHEPFIIAGVPVSYSKEEGYLTMTDGYMLEVAPFSFYSGKYTGLQIDPETREVTRSILVGDEDYYPCPQQTQQTSPSP